MSFKHTAVLSTHSGEPAPAKTPGRVPANAWRYRFVSLADRLLVELLDTREKASQDIDKAEDRLG